MRSNPSTWRRPWLAAGLALAMAGCQPGKPHQVPAARQVRVGSPDAVAGAPSGATPDQIVSNDPCAVRLHDIEGAILMYYLVNKKLPDELPELSQFADADQPLNFVCPTSGQPYVYVPGGLHSPGRTKFIILHDAAPSHNGKRDCILMSPVKPGGAASLDVVGLPEPLFRAYLPAIGEPVGTGAR